MGYTSCTSWNKKSDVINELKRDLSKYHLIIADKSTSTGYWAVIEKLETKKRHIFFALIKKHGKDFYMKDMDESMGPADLSCPVKFFDMVPCPETGYAKEWRERVRQAAIKKPKVEIKDGNIIKLYDKLLNVLYFDNTRKRWIVQDMESMGRYFLKPKQLKELEIVET